jgi:hypothetical protein
MHSPGPVAPLPIDSFLSFARSPFLSYTDFSSSIVSRFPFTHSSHEHSLIFDRIIHPYNFDAFEFMLRKHNLFSHYSLVPHNLQFGFPLGYMPPLLQTLIIPNNPSAIFHADVIDEYLRKEVLARRMSGPFSREEAELIMRGPFQSSPLIVSIQPQQPGVPDKLRICRHLSKATKTHSSVNSHICKDSFPTRFDTASKVAEIVSFRLSVFFSPPYSLSFYAPLCA